MKVTLDLPDWIDERNLYIFAGIEPVARRLVSVRQWEVKVKRCSSCGKCCENLGKSPFGDVGRCQMLKTVGKGGECIMGVHRPHGCSVSQPYDIKECAIKWQPIGQKCRPLGSVITTE